MGYHTALHLIDIRIKDTSVPTVKKALETKSGRGLRHISSFLEEVHLRGDRFLYFRSNAEYDDDCDDQDISSETVATVPVSVGRWYRSEAIAEWLKLHCEKGGRLIHHSCEEDGEAWGWEFNGRGKLRELSLSPVGRWK